MQGDHDPYAALRHSDYRRFLTGAVLASIGGEMLAVAIGWEVYRRTPDKSTAKLLLGLTGLAQFLPVLLLALPAGQAADRYSRKLLLQAAQATMALASLGLAAISWAQGPIWLIFVCLVGVGCSRALSMPTRTALVPQIVPAEHIANAITWNSSSFQVASVTGPALGGLVLAVWDTPAIVYALTAACSLSCVALLVPIKPRRLERPPEVRSLTSLLAGVRFVLRTELLLAAITLDLFAVLLGGATALLPVFADLLQVGPIGFGWLRAAPALGALVMAILIAHRPPFRRAGRALLLAVVGFGLATIVFGLSRNFVLSFAMLALAGGMDNISVVIRGTLVQLLTPDGMRGRVSAVNAIFISSSNQLGEFESGVTAAWFGTVESVVGGGVGTILVVLIVMLRWPRLRCLGPLRPQEPPAELGGGEVSETPAASG